MDPQIHIRTLHESEVEAAHVLVSSVFDQFVAPLFSAEGIAQFKSFIAPVRLEAMLRQDCFMLVAEEKADIVGVAGVRDWSHIFLLFVQGRHQGRGIGGALVREVLARCEQADCRPRALTVNASPNAVEAYRRMGFVVAAPEEERRGVRAVPMILTLPSGEED